MRVPPTVLSGSWNNDGVRVRRVVTTRAGGRSQPPYESFNLGDHVGDDPGAVAANRLRLAEGVGLPEDRLVWMEQVHGRTATVVSGPVAGPVEATDALVTAEPGLALVALVADCVPVLLADPQAGVVAAVHAGRVGARVGVVPAALAAMEQAGAAVDRVEVLLGPSVCGDCYEVPAAMREDVEAHLPGSAAKTRGGKPSLDLRAGLWNQLAAAGVAKVGVDPRCTVEDRTLFSHRREGRTGRLAAVTWIEP
ncbi:peptidoglycan editing factor PgeF [Kutzneria viridogrisea]